ncbi:MAG: PorT family protein, partial [Cytophagales bacterium]|nr:PorT family protein [Cytophagales bacterium]
DADHKMKIGFQAGAFAEFQFSDAFSIQPELLYSLEGAKTKGEGSVPVNASYLNIPVLVKYYITEGLSLQAGPQIGFLMGANMDGESDLGELGKVKDMYKSTNFGLVFGAGYDITENIGVDVRYNLGLTEVPEEEGEVKTSNIIIGVSYKF